MRGTANDKKTKIKQVVFDWLDCFVDHHKALVFEVRVVAKKFHPLRSGFPIKTVEQLTEELVCC